MWQTCRWISQNQEKIQGDFRSERLGEQSLYENFGKIFKPITEQQQKSSEEIVSKFALLQEAIENMPAQQALPWDMPQPVALAELDTPQIKLDETSISPNWPPAAWLIWSKGRCLAQSCSNLPGNKRSLKQNDAWLDLLRTAPSRGRTAQCYRPTQGEVLVVCSMKKLFRRRSSVSLNHGNGRRTKFCCSETHQSFRERNTVTIQYKKLNSPDRKSVV